VNEPSPLLIYIVEDDQSVRSSLARLIRSAELNAREYPDAESFLGDIEADARGCVLLDMTLPCLNGLDVQRSLRSRGIDIPVIAVSACDDDEVEAQSFELGAQCFMRKPVDDHALIDTIVCVLSAR